LYALPVVVSTSWMARLIVGIGLSECYLLIEYLSRFVSDKRESNALAARYSASSTQGGRFACQTRICGLSLGSRVADRDGARQSVLRLGDARVQPGYASLPDARRTRLQIEMPQFQFVGCNFCLGQLDEGFVLTREIICAASRWDCGGIGGW
jgi:hypothetical protein